jgi:serine protease Do
MARAGSASRETRLLAATIVVSVIVLLVLGRFRFPGAVDAGVDPVAAQPLARLASRAAFDDLSLALTQLNSRVGPSLVVLRISLQSADHDAGAPPPTTLFLPGVRVRDDVALARLPRDARVEGLVGAPGAVSIVGADPVRELALVRIPSQPAQVLAIREGTTPLASPGYVAMAIASRTGVALQPLFVGRSDVQPDPRWDAPLLTLGPGSRAEPGAAVFSLDGRFAGLATTTDEEGVVLLVPADHLMASVERLLAGGAAAPGDIGIATQPLDARTARLTKAPAGAVVSAVVADGPSHDKLWVGDVVTAVNGQLIATPQALALRVARTAPNTTISLTVLRGGTYETVPVVVGPAPQGLATPSVASTRPDGDVDLGLTLRAVSARGAEVVRVRDESAAARAGLRPGDLIVSVGRTRTPAPAQVTEAWETLDEGTTLFLGVERGGRALALVLEK